MQIGEPMTAPDVHGPENDKCPFCPAEEPPKFTSYPGADNNSKILAKLMEQPGQLVSQQSNARPKDGKKGNQGPSSPRPYPEKPFTHPLHGKYSYEAHHLISGKQALARSSFEQWICAGGSIAADTGYSVNNPDNGKWLPSVPYLYMGQWGSLDFDEKLSIAKRAMEANEGQFHKGPHSISDPADPGEIKHKKYDQALISDLNEMAKDMKDWSAICPLCPKTSKPKPQPSVRANAYLDKFSASIERELTGPIAQWKVFISRCALETHRPLCKHTGQNTDA